VLWVKATAYARCDRALFKFTSGGRELEQGGGKDMIRRSVYGQTVKDSAKNVKLYPLAEHSYFRFPQQGSDI
jgi:hypothetical protein